MIEFDNWDILQCESMKEALDHLDGGSGLN